MPFKRYLRPAYADGISQPRARLHGQLPSPRAISSRLMGRASVPSKKFSHMLMIWGQFVDHDMTKAAITKARDAISDLPHDPACCSVLGPNERRHPECLPISIPSNDYFYREYNQSCMEFVRSLPATRENCSLGYREQLNELTAFLDGSNVYGSTLKYQQHLRRGRKGQMKSQQDLLHPKGLLPFDETFKIDCPMKTKFLKCFMAGDTRANEHTGLAALHTVWLREHNRVALELAALNPAWNDDRVFHETRKIIGAMIQHITFNEFLPVILGENVMRQYNLTLGSPAYDANRNPTIANVFSSAIFRFGHTLIQGDFMLMSGDHHKMRMEDLVNNFMRPFNLLLPERVDAFMMGMAGQEAQEMDNNFNERIMNHLFQNRNFDFGMDLIAINIQRGRDHGLPDYNSWRRVCGLAPHRSMRELMTVMRPLETPVDFGALYMTPDEVDLFPAGMSEKPYDGGGSLLGPTFSCLMAQQFSDVKNGDRFWYENEGLPNSFRPEQIREINKSSLANILCNNLDTTTETQRWALRLHDDVTNPMVKCGDLPAMDLTVWKE